MQRADSFPVGLVCDPLERFPLPLIGVQSCSAPHPTPRAAQGRATENRAVHTARSSHWGFRGRLCLWNVIQRVKKLNMHLLVQIFVAQGPVNQHRYVILCIPTNKANFFFFSVASETMGNEGTNPSFSQWKPCNTFHSKPWHPAHHSSTLTSVPAMWEPK